LRALPLYISAAFHTFTPNNISVAGGTTLLPVSLLRVMAAASIALSYSSCVTAWRSEGGSVTLTIALFPFVQRSRGVHGVCGTGARSCLAALAQLKCCRSSDIGGLAGSWLSLCGGGDWRRYALVYVRRVTLLSCARLRMIGVAHGVACPAHSSSYVVEKCQ
jgi:hypothetical protein